jgi:hypothetical protein
MPRVKANGIEIEYEEFGASQDPLIVLIAGFGEQMGSVEFPSDFCQDLSSEGLRVVRFDNRDVGLSTHFTASVAESGAAPYTVVDMSDDVVGLVAALGVHATHLVGGVSGWLYRPLDGDPTSSLVRSLSLIMTPCGAKRGTEALKRFSEPAPQALERMLDKTRPETERRRSQPTLRPGARTRAHVFHSTKPGFVGAPSTATTAPTIPPGLPVNSRRSSILPICLMRRRASRVPPL